jgi:HlyD family secretion protein
VRALLRKLPVLVIVCCVAAFLLYGFWPKPVRVDTAEVELGSLQVTVNDDGETRIREKYVVSSPLAGQLLRLQLHPGDPVEQSKTELAQILPVEPALLDSRSQAEVDARVEVANAAMLQADAARESAKELAMLAQHNLDRAQRLINTKAISLQEFDDAEHQLAVAQANVRAAEFSCKVRAFEKEQALAAAARISDTSPDRKNSALKIVSPTSGTVLRVLREDAGVVSIGTPLIEVGDVKDLEMVLDILSSEAARIQPGDRVLVERWGGEQVLQGSVRRIEPSAFLKVSALGVEEKRVNVIADFQDPWELRRQLGDGFRIEVKIVIHETEPHSLKIAAGAIFRYQDRWHAYRINLGIARLVPVEVGASNGLETEIVSGLEAGDLVVLYPTEQIHDGVRVELNR